jgi:hypothetical protein
MIGYIIQGENPAHWHVQCEDDNDLIEYVKNKGNALFDELDTDLLVVCEDPGGRIVGEFLRDDNEEVRARVREAIAAHNANLNGG